MKVSCIFFLQKSLVCYHLFIHLVIVIGVSKWYTEPLRKRLTGRCTFSGHFQMVVLLCVVLCWWPFFVNLLLSTYLSVARPLNKLIPSRIQKIFYTSKSHISPYHSPFAVLLAKKFLATLLLGIFYIFIMLTCGGKGVSIKMHMIGVNKANIPRQCIDKNNLIFCPLVNGTGGALKKKSVTITTELTLSNLHQFGLR